MRPMKAIGLVHCQAKYRYEAPRQAVLADDNSATIELYPGDGVREALMGLEGFERIWVIYEFHLNEGFTPFVKPPRKKMLKVGYMATRSPHRPNRIGMSCVPLLGIDGLQLHLGTHDLLDRTPVLDIKPYLPYADSFPRARAGWVDAYPTVRYELRYSPLAEAQVRWVQDRTGFDLRHFLHVQLSEEPTDGTRKRVCPAPASPHYEIAFRTWRVDFTVQEAHTLGIDAVRSGYRPEELISATDPYADKAIHQDFCVAFQAAREP